jgi:thiol:disulfide interchange protein DsbG
MVAAAVQSKPTPAEQYLLSKGVKILQSFPSASGLRAIVADSGTEKRLFYVTPDGKSLILGLVFDTEGNSVTGADMKKAGVSAPGAAVNAPAAAAGPAPAALTGVGAGSSAVGNQAVAGTVTPKPMNDAQLRDLWDRAEKRRWIQEGNSDKIIYVLFDANCTFCHKLWGALRAGIQSGKFQVRWLPVALLAPTSKELGAAIYSSKSPSEALAKMASRQLQPVKVSDRDNLDMAYNMLLLRDTGYTGVPVMLFKRGNRIVSMVGAPDDRELSALTQ